MTNRILRRPEVERLTGRSRTAIYEEMKTGNFPSSVRIGARAVGWFESDVQAWIESRERVLLQSGAKSGPGVQR
ncbi:MAG: AlpA family phage regulatory protein [Halofilum sp. (in: g-proteobacteria)]